MSETHDWKDDPRLVAYALEEWAELSESDVDEIKQALVSEEDPRCREVLGEIRALIPDIERTLKAEGGLATSGGSGVGTLTPIGSDQGEDASGPRLAGEARAQIALAARRGAPSGNWGVPAMAAAALALVAGGVAWEVGRRPGAPSVDGVVESEMASVEESTLPAVDKQSGGRGRGVDRPIGGLQAEPRSGGAKAGSLDLSRGSDRGGAAPKPGTDMPRESGTSLGTGPTTLGRRKGELRESLKSATARNQAPRPAEMPKEQAATKGPDRSRSAPRRTESLAQRPSQEPLRKAVAGREDKRVAAVEGQVEARELERMRKRMAVSPPEEVIEGSGDVDQDSEVPLSEEMQIEAEPPLPENPFIDAASDPFSTFSIDVDTASYASARASIAAGSLPPRESVRVEEFINYFTYGDKAPKAGDERPFAVHVDTGAAPWAPDHRLVRIGLKARSMDFVQRKRSSLVFLVDVSGSMRRANKLPLVKKALAILTESLHPEDRVAIAVYASERGLALDSTPVAAREAILQSLDRLEGGGSTDGGTGIRLAYSVARDHFIEGGVNRVVLCTDGDFNVGITDAGELEKLIAQEAESGVELTVLGFGAGSVSGDGRMEALSNRGNGNYAMIDSELEARKVLATEVGGTLLTVAKDVKIQVAWNPELVGAFRLIGYENRMLTHAQFLDDKKDAGEIGAGHGVTALYEVVPAAKPELVGQLGALDEAEAPLRARLDAGLGAGGGGKADSAPDAFVGEGLLEVRLRYKQPAGTQSVGFSVKAIDEGAGFNGAPEDLRFAASVAAFAMMLRGSESVDGLSLEDIRSWSLESKGADPGGLREGFIQMVESVIDQGKRAGGR